MPGSEPGKPAVLDAEALEAQLEKEGPLTLGVEEELMLLDPDTINLAPVAETVLGRLEGDPRFKPELPASQLESISPPCQSAAEALRALAAARHDLAGAAEGLALPAGGGAHPFARAPAELSGLDRYEPTRREYGPIAQRQLVFGLHVHVRVSGAKRTVAIYNALRSHLPTLAALAANAPFYEGEDAGLASVRPKLSELLPRQGVPPAISGINELVDALSWGLRSGALPGPRSWWWELRIHPVYGTIEVRVPDQQARATESAAIAAVVHALVAWLAERFDTGEQLPVHPTWRIAENRWSACRHGVEGTFADLESGERRATRAHVTELLDCIAPQAAALGGQAQLAEARLLLDRNGAMRLREVPGDTAAVCHHLAAQFLAD